MKTDFYGLNPEPEPKPEQKQELETYGNKL